MDWPGTLPLSNLDKLRIEAASDEALRKQLINDPASVLAERGIEIPSGVTVRIVEDTLDTYNLTLPPYVGGDLSAQALKVGSAQASTYECTTCTVTTPICFGSLASLVCAAAK
ncbi:MAG TPA: hypothetical protein VF715_15255 [Thermoleophilaceae bacterium]|jgi:hypothetical protein